MSYRWQFQARFSWAIVAFVLLAVVGVPGVAQDVQYPWLTPESGSIGGADGRGHQFGDPNCDGLLNFLDIDPFVLALMNPAGYHEKYPGCDILQCDFNCDNLVNFDDINAFIYWATCLECGPGPWYCNGY